MATHYKAEGEEVDAEGLDATVKKKLDAKYDHAVEAEVREWMGSVLGKPVEGDLMEVLKSGVLLCELANKLRPGIVKKVNKMKMPFMQMENIGFFLAAVHVLGVDASESFMTVDLYEAKNPGAVLLCLEVLKRLSASPGAAAQAEHSGMDPHSAAVAIQKVAKGKVTRKRVNTAGLDGLLPGQSTGTQSTVEEGVPPEPQPEANPEAETKANPEISSLSSGSELVRGSTLVGTTTAGNLADEEDDDDNPAPAPAPAPVQAKSPAAGAESAGMETSQTSSAGTGVKPELQRDSKHSGDMHYRADDEEVDAEGLDTTLKKKLDAKYNHELEAEVREWMGTILEQKIEGSLTDPTPFMELLKSGVLLCNLVNKLKPGSVKKVNKMKMAFMQMENIGSFLAAAQSLGLDASETFMTVDLYEAKNPGAVLLCLDSLRRAAA